MKSANRLNFFQKIKMKYKVSVLNENTLEEVFHVRMSAQRFFFTFIFILLAVLVLFSTLILTTPLRQLLPDNISSDIRKEAVKNALIIDSLTEEVSFRQAYINTFRDLVTGDIVIKDSLLNSDSIIAKQRDEQLLEKSQLEKEFCEEFEEEERYKISATTNNSNNNLVFFKPTIGDIEKGFDPINGHLGIDITTKPSTPIVSIYQGTVLYSAYTLDDDYFIQIIHPQGFISVYKGAANVFKKSGDIVKSGEVIAIMSEKSTKETSLHFELWKESQAQNPLNYIVFE